MGPLPPKKPTTSSGRSESQKPKFTTNVLNHINKFCMNDKTNATLKECRQGRDFRQSVRKATLEVAWDIRMTQKTHGLSPDTKKFKNTLSAPSG